MKRAAKTAGIFGAAVGVAAAGLATAFAVERVLVRRSVNAPGDPYVEEPFGDQQFDAERTVTAADGTDLHVEIVEPDEPNDRPTIVFVHGFALDMGTFYFQRKELAERGEYRMVFYDQPGHGRSGKLQSGTYDIAALGRSLAAVLESTVPDGHIILVGHSMGGMTIMAFAEQYPEWFGNRVTGVVLMSTSAGLIDKAQLGVTNLVARASAPFFPLWDKAAHLGGGTIDRARVASSDLAWLLTRRYGFGEAKPSATLVTFVESMNSKTSVETLTKYLHTLYTHNRFPALSALRGVPVLVVVGDRDYLTPVTHSEEILKHLPEAELLKIENSGHVVMLEKSEQVNAALIPFLEKIT
ncbi:pimeloyl-ACP methyl ester carboxylesterase [Actinoplanes lutulentus]|uniref:Pimeloyl-ACP methyl ester carboxylesterase n=1 Tax=Actinoplanes lutulentus TaxID=1287878 RepID=A0A327ZIG5_9ACTN|nr:alpha/beta hydrolase [Actinoplanes lutulentus]MBB2945441.1 pimeloyl-ACP methyl ester carboxylesterase [Actinoplanes lutulentus]RAK40428.1 pimeloyl-ACP methyl ester carboxylesterase [Actinoplanes lutulentus]